MALGNRIIFVKNVKAKPSSHRSRTPGFLRIAPIDSGQQITELGRGDRHRAVGRARPQKAAPFQPLRKQAGSLAVMPDHLQKIAPASTKAKQLPAQRITSQHLLHLQRQARKALPHVGVTGRQPHPDAARNWDHGRVSSPTHDPKQGLHIYVAIDNNAPTVRAHDLDSTTARFAALFRLLRNDHRRHESASVAKLPFAIRLAPARTAAGWKSHVGAPSPMPAGGPEGLSSTIRSFSAADHRRRRPVSNNFKAIDMASVSKVIHTDNQLQAGQFDKAAYVG